MRLHDPTMTRHIYMPTSGGVSSKKHETASAENRPNHDVTLRKDWSKRRQEEKNHSAPAAADAVLFVPHDKLASVSQLTGD